jgi:hypothetical protein
MNIRISTEHIQREMASMSPSGIVVAPPDTFARERLTVGNWPTDENAWAVIAQATWDACADPDSPRPRDPLCLSADVTPDASAGSIAICGRRPDGKLVVEIAEGDHRSGTNWIVPRLAELRARLRNRVCAIVIDKSGPAAMLLAEAEKAGLVETPPASPPHGAATPRAKITGGVQTPTLNEVGQAFGTFYVAVADQRLVHLGADLQPDLRAAVAGAARRDIGDGGHAWARKATTIDISPLVAATLAVWGHGKYTRRSSDLSRTIY